MSLLERLKALDPELAPPVRFATERGLEVYMEAVLRQKLEDQMAYYRLERLPDGRYVAEVRLKGRRATALSFSGWKALGKAYLEARG